MQRAINAYFLIWAGIAIGVSLIATPAKFLAPGLSLPDALQVGRVTFRVLGIVEAGLFVIAVIMIVLVFSAAWHALKRLVVLAGLLLTQYVVLLPILSSNTNEIVAGAAQQSTSSAHWLYVLVELVKIGFLIYLGLRNRPES